MAEEQTTTEEKAQTTTTEVDTKDPSFLDEVMELMDEQAKEEQDKVRADAKGPDDIEKSEKSEEATEEVEKEEQVDDGEATPVVDDSLLERAVQAGMTLAEAKAVSDPEALDSIVGRLEAASKPDSADAEAAEAEAKQQMDDALAKLDLNDGEDGFAPELVEAMKTMKDLLVAQRDEIAELKSRPAAAAEPQTTWVDGEIAKLGADWADTFPEGKVGEAAKAKLERHIDFVKSDAEADGKKVTNANAFKQAVANAFGDKVKSLKGAKAKETAAKRSEQALNKPRHADGTFGTNKDSGMPKTEAERDEAALADIAKWFDKD